MKGGRAIDRVLPGHGVDHEKDLVRLGRGDDLGDLGHHRLVDVKAAGRVDDERVATFRRGTSGE